MVFSKIIDNIKNVLDDSKNKGKEYYNKRSNDILLNQGKLHKFKKKNKINKFNKKKHLIENNSNFNKGDTKLNDGIKRVKLYLEDMEEDYNNKLSAWSMKSKTYMENYNLLIDEINLCKKNCGTQFPQTISVDGKLQEDRLRKKKIESCMNGCQLREPKIQDLQDNPGTNCANVKCIERNVMPNLAENDQPTEEEIRDCAACGGGFGGHPIIRAQGNSNSLNITKCIDSDKAYGESGTQLRDACRKGAFDYFNNKQISFSGDTYTLPGNKIINFNSDYNSLLTESEHLNSSAKKLENETNKLRSRRKKIMTSLSKLEGMTPMSDLIDQYDEIYEKKSLERGETDTQKAQLEDIELKLRSQQLQLYLWSSLAILTMLLVIQKIRQ